MDQRIDHFIRNLLQIVKDNPSACLGNFVRTDQLINYIEGAWEETVKEFGTFIVVADKD